MSDWVAVRPIDYPLGSGVLAFNEGDSVPDGHVKAYGYDKVPEADGGPYVKRADAGTAAAKPKKAQPHKAAQAHKAQGDTAPADA